jgi:predicted lipoprotein with Yx(FWY)xxD motif
MITALGVTATFASPADAVKKRAAKPSKKATPKATTTTEAPAVEAPPTTAPATTVAPAALFSIRKSQLGEILVTPDGLSLYNFDPDAKKPGGSVCNGPCADVWVPIIIKSEAQLVAPKGFTGKLTAAKRDDGSLQAAVNGWPIYSWVFDKKPGDLNGQAVNEVWWVFNPSGELIRTSPTIRFRQNKLGTATANSSMMVGTSGKTLYMYEPDKKNGVSTCYDQCAIAWPPLLVSSEADLAIWQGVGVDRSKVTLFPRADTNQLQVAYDGWPLYYWFRDEKPGDTKGQAVGNVWWVLDTSGVPVRTK